MQNVGKPRFTALRFIFVTLILFSSPGAAETLPVVIADDLVRNLPRLVERVKSALTRSGHQFDWQVRPNKRSFQMLVQGEAAIELIRTTINIEDYPYLSAIQPPSSRVEFQMITSKKSAHFCDADEQAYASMSIAGVIGVDPHTDYYYPKFGHNSELTNFPNAYRYVGLGRADVMFLPKPIVDKIPPGDRELLEVCAGRVDVFPLHTLIHRDYLWAKDSIEEAFRKEFGAE